MGSITRFTGTVFYSLLYLNSRRGFNGLKYINSVISVSVYSLCGNTKKLGIDPLVDGQSAIVHPWADHAYWFYNSIYLVFFSVSPCYEGTGRGPPRDSARLLGESCTKKIEGPSGRCSEIEK